MGKMRVLVVEDDEAIATLISMALKRLDIESYVCHRGDEACAMLEREGFGCIITDIRLPGKDGLEVATQARKSTLNPNTPIIIVSGQVDKQAVFKAGKIGNASLIVKPFKMEDFTRKVQAKLTMQKKSMAYDVRLIKSVLGAVSEILEFYFWTKPQIGQPGVRRAVNSLGGKMLSSIPIEGSEISGMLYLRYDSTFLSSFSRQIHSGRPQSRILKDLPNEICNQICGKIKVRLQSLGVQMAIGRPRHVSSYGQIHRESPLLHFPYRIADCAFDVEFQLVQTPQLSEQKSDESQPNPLALTDIKPVAEKDTSVELDDDMELWPVRRNQSPG